MQAPIFVSRQIVLEDAIKISYGMGKKRDTKFAYDVSLDRYCAHSWGPYICYHLLLLYLVAWVVSSPMLQMVQI